MSYDYIQKHILLGDSASGKSSILMRLTDNKFNDMSEPTIGVEFGSLIVELPLEEGGDRAKRVKVQIWDTAGQETFRSITRSYYRGAEGALLLFDVTNRSSFNHCQTWLGDIREWGEPDVVILLIGNKSDLESRREVPLEEARLWAEENNLAGYVETSAKEDVNVRQSLDQLTTTVSAIQRKKTSKKSKDRGLSLSSSRDYSFGCC